MKKFLALAFLICTSFAFCNAQTCNTKITQIAPTSQDWSFAITVQAEKLSNGLYPAILEIVYQNKDGLWSKNVLGGGNIGTTQLGYNPLLNLPSYNFYNMSNPCQMYVRTSKVLIEQLNPSNPYYAMYLLDIDAAIAGDSSKWCYSTPITVSFSDPIAVARKGKGKGK